MSERSAGTSVEMIGLKITSSKSNADLEISQERVSELRCLTAEAMKNNVVARKW